jgi:lambda family phage minor tail protein L
LTTASGIKKEIQKLSPDTAMVELYSIDLNPLGVNTIYYFTPGTISGTSVVFNGITYTPIPVETDGYEYNGEGKLQRPRLKVSNINHSLLASVIGYNDLVGARITRRRTFVKYLDGQASANPTEQLSKDIFIIERKTKQNKFELEFELVSSLDTEDKQIPAKQVLESCTHRYRCYSGGAFDYTDVYDCTYRGASYFTAAGATTANPAEDNCGRRLKDCKLRFGLLVPLPYGGFPNVAKFSVNYKK